MFSSDDRYINVTWGNTIFQTSKLSVFTRVLYCQLTKRQFTYRNMDANLDLPQTHSKKRKLLQQDDATAEAKVPKSRPSRFIPRLLAVH